MQREDAYLIHPSFICKIFFVSWQVIFFFFFPGNQLAPKIKHASL